MLRLIQLHQCETLLYNLQGGRSFLTSYSEEGMILTNRKRVGLGETHEVTLVS